MVVRGELFSTSLSHLFTSNVSSFLFVVIVYIVVVASVNVGSLREVRGCVASVAGSLAITIVLIDGVAARAFIWTLILNLGSLAPPSSSGGCWLFSGSDRTSLLDHVRGSDRLCVVSKTIAAPFQIWVWSFKSTPDHSRFELCFWCHISLVHHCSLASLSLFSFYN